SKVNAKCPWKAAVSAQGHKEKQEGASAACLYFPCRYTRGLLGLSLQSFPTCFFQRANMGALFARFPQALLVHRFCAPSGRALYIFVADGPCLAVRRAAGRVVHLAVPRNETASGLARMCEAFRAFNPAWWRTRVLLVGPDLPEPMALGQAFPAAEVRLSAFHVCKHLQEQIQRLGLEPRAERLLLSTLQSTMCGATEGKRKEMHRVLNETVPPDLLPRFHAHWLLTDKIWATYGERGSKKSDYFMELEAVTQGLSQIFSAELFLETCIASLAKYYQKCVSEGSPCDTVISPPDAEECIMQSLSDICTDSAARLCLSELAVVQKSVQLIGTNADAVSVQILEDAHRVTQEGLGSCTCHFNQTFQLPCRHIQAVLNSERKTLQPEMLERQKGCDVIQGMQDDADHLLEDLESPWDESRDKYLAVSSLTAEVSRLLASCSTEEFELRCSTLRALADSWIGPYMQVKL
uniref:Zinc finger SWIM-type containing 1 n=1 Tax=Coturnix japonica TaxID=93934 RepID=A0A8C2T391_COTJA